MDKNLSLHFVAQKYFFKLFHTLISPTLESFSRYKIFLRDEEVFREIKFQNEDNNNEKINSEFDTLSLLLNERYKQVKLNYPIYFKAEVLSSHFLYSLIRLSRPAKVVETGVANGHSSYFLLNALLNNGNGELFSFDVSDNVGTLLSERERSEWHLNILPNRNNKRHFREKLKEIGTVDIFIHDSNHFYYWQIFEYKSVWDYIKTGGFLLSDDVDSSYAFLDFCEEIKVTPLFLFDGRRIFGIIRKL